MYKRILVPIDGSETSERTLREAIKLSNSETQLRLVYVLNEINYFVDAESYTLVDYVALKEAMQQTGEHVLAQAAEIVRQSGIAMETALVNSSGERIASVIEGEAKHWRADLIVIGTHGRSGLNRLLLGSVAEGVVRLTSVPVLLVRAE
jgi:nucleotide-binding universal stress UspA family protein